MVWAESFDCWLSFSAKLAKILAGAFAGGGAVEDGNCSFEVDDLVKRLVFWVGPEDSGAEVSGAPRLPKESGRAFVPGKLAPMVFVVEE